MKKSVLEKISLLLFLVIIICISLYSNIEEENYIISNTINSYKISDIPEYNGEIYVVINDNIPEFSQEDLNISSDYYSSLVDGKVRN